MHAIWVVIVSEIVGTGTRGIWKVMHIHPYNFTQAALSLVQEHKHAHVECYVENLPPIFA